MDFCGNPFHDIPQLLLLAAPFLGFAGVWIRGYFKKHKHGEDKPQARRGSRGNS